MCQGQAVRVLSYRTTMRYVLRTTRIQFLTTTMLGLRVGRASGFARLGKPTRHFVPSRGVKTPTIDWTPIKSSVNNLSRAENQSKSPIFRRVVLGLMIAMPIVSFFLGCWQIKRLEWKVDLISRSEHLLAEPPMEGLPKVIDPSVIGDFEFRRFKVKGHFDYDKELYLGPRIRNGEVGYLLVTPFVRSDGGKPILIERGWIQKELVIPKRRSKGYLSHLALPQGEIEIQAMFRKMPSKSYLQYDHEPGTRLFHIPDVEAMAEELGALPVYAQMMYSLKDKPEWKGPEEASQKNSKWKKLLGLSTSSNVDHLPLSETDSTLAYQEFEFIDQGVPLAALPKVSFTNNHMQYLITWFGVSIASTALLFWTFYKKRDLLSAEKVIEAKRREMKRHF